jgi:hypothetical protein
MKRAVVIRAGARKDISWEPVEATTGATVGAVRGVRTVTISSLVRDPAFQVRQGVDERTASRYANVLAEGRTMPPIKVANVNGALVVVDGWHRIEAHERRGLCNIDAEVITATASEAQWMAAEANLTHGLPLRNAEIRTAFRALIHARRHIPRPGTLLSYRDLAGLLGGLKRHTTIRNWMLADFPAIACRMTEDAPVEGNREAARDEEATFANSFRASIDSAQAASGAIRNPQTRGRMIASTERLLKELLAGGRWLPHMPDEF